jgi:hypothetical protein
MPEQNRLHIVLTAAPTTNDDLNQLGMQVVIDSLVSMHVASQRAERQAFTTLASIVHHNLAHDVRERHFDYAHGALGHHQRFTLDLFDLVSYRPLPGQARCLDHDVGAEHACRMSTAIIALPRTFEATSQKNWGFQGAPNGREFHRSRSDDPIVACSN